MVGREHTKVVKTSPKKRLTKKQTYAVITVVTIIVALYIYASFSAWTSLNKAPEQAVKDAKSAALVIFSKPSKASTQQRTQAVDKLVEVTATNAFCNTVWWYGWQQQIVPAAKRTERSCLAVKQRLDSANFAAKKVQTYIVDETKLAKTLFSLEIKQKKLTDKNWNQEAIQGVKDTSQEVEEASYGSEEFDAVKAKAVKRVKAVGSAWRMIEKANRDKNRSAYEGAIDTLDNAYGQLASIKELSQLQLNRLLAELQTFTSKL